MFREMRRINQQLDEKLSLEILEKASSGVLALLGDEGYPYTVPMNHVYKDGKIYFHCSKVGHKIDAIKGYDKASFCVIEKDTVVPEEYATHYSSVVVFGKIRIIEDEAEKRRSIELLTSRHGTGDAEKDRRAIDAEYAAVCMLELTIEHITGKEAKALAKRRKEQ